MNFTIIRINNISITTQDYTATIIAALKGLFL